MSVVYEGIGEGRLFIDGKRVDAVKGGVYDNINPATEEIIGTAADATAEDMELAITAARRAFDESEWSTDVALRLKCLRQLEDGLKQVRDELREQVVVEVGAPMGIVQGPQCDGPIEMIDWTLKYLENFTWQRVSGEYEVMGTKSKHLVFKEAIGVVAAITPWNFPVQINLAKIIPALAAGCTVVLKAAPETPWCATMLGRVVEEFTDIPAGVFNVITSKDPVATGEMLSKDARVDMVSFTGSTQVGRQIMAMAAPTVKKVFLELGGKSAYIILDDANLDEALLSTLGICFHAGQGCAIATRLLLPEEKYEESIEKLKMFFGFISTGDPQSMDQIMGPLISKKQYKRVLDYIEKGKTEGARLVCGGARPDGLTKGYYVAPTLFADVTNDMTIAQEEIFGPVLVAIAYKDEADAIRIANDSIFGLSAMVASASDERAMSVAKKLRTGTVNVNGGNFLGPDSPFGGYKQSGIGREMGVEGFEEYLETKTVAVKA